MEARRLESLDTNWVAVAFTEGDLDRLVGDLQHLGLDICSGKIVKTLCCSSSEGWEAELGWSDAHTQSRQSCA